MRELKPITELIQGMALGLIIGGMTFMFILLISLI